MIYFLISLATLISIYDNGGHGAISELEDVRKHISIFLNLKEDISTE